jgi:hypothetical protein
LRCVACDAAGITLIAIARQDGFEVFTSSHRVTGDSVANAPIAAAFCTISIETRHYNAFLGCDPFTRQSARKLVERTGSFAQPY